MTANGMEFCWGNANFLKFDCGDGFTTEYTKTHLLVPFKWVNCVICELYLNKAIKRGALHSVVKST